MQEFLQFIILMLIYISTCFGRPHAHHQKPNNCSSSLWFYLRCMVVAVLFVVVGPAGPTTTNSTATTTLPTVKPEAASYCSCWASDNGIEDARNMLRCK
jgi:hypothetical protein